MLSRTNRSRLMVAAAVTLASLIALAPALAAQALVVQSVSVNGGVVQVTVANVSSASASGTVAIQTIVNDTPIWSFVPVALAAGQSATISAAAGGPVESPTTVGVSEDPNPY